MLLDADCCDPLYRKAIRASVGATLLVPFARRARHQDRVDLLERHAFDPVALSPAGSCLLKDWLPGPRTAVLLGAEGPGVSAVYIQRTHSIQIAMSAGFDSLKVATTSGIIFLRSAHRADRRLESRSDLRSCKRELAQMTQWSTHLRRLAPIFLFSGADRLLVIARSFSRHLYQHMLRHMPRESE